MLQFHKMDKYFWLFVVLLSSFFYLIVSMQANELQSQISSTSAFLKFLYATNNIVAFCIPIIVFVFFLSTIRIMLQLFESKQKVDFKEIDIRELVAYSLIPHLIFMIFYAFILVFFDIEISGIENLESAKLAFGIDFFFIRKLSYLSWILVYVILFFLLFLRLRLSFVNSLTIVIVPSLIVYLFRVFLL